MESMEKRNYRAQKQHMCTKYLIERELKQHEHIARKKQSGQQLVCARERMREENLYGEIVSDCCIRLGYLLLTSL
jgi:hypothetical protein